MKNTRLIMLCVIFIFVFLKFQYLYSQNTVVLKFGNLTQNSTMLTNITYGKTDIYLHPKNGASLEIPFTSDSIIFTVNKKIKYALYPKQGEEYEIKFKSTIAGPIAFLKNVRQGIDTAFLNKKVILKDNTSPSENKKKTNSLVNKVEFTTKDSSQIKLSANQSGLSIEKKDTSTTDKIKLGKDKVSITHQSDSTKYSAELNKNKTLSVSHENEETKNKVTIGTNKIELEHKKDSLELQAKISDGNVQVSAIIDSSKISISKNDENVILGYGNEKKEQTMSISKDGLSLSQSDKETNQSNTLAMSLKKGLDYSWYQKTYDDSIRANWMKKGGNILMETYNFDFTYLTLKIDSMDSRFNTYGFGYTRNDQFFSYRLKNLKTKTQTQVLFSYGFLYSIGTTLGFNNTSFSYYMPVFQNNNLTYEMHTISVNTIMLSFYTYLAPKISLNMGIYQPKISFNKIKGVSFSFSYQPTLMLLFTTVGSDVYDNNELISSDINGDAFFNINLLSYGFDINFSDLSSFISKNVPPAGLKLYVKVFPKFGEIKYTFINFGIGINSFYRLPKRHTVNPL